MESLGNLELPWLSLGVAAGLGLLVGLQRERAEPNRAGIRTFPLITLLGTISAYLGRHFGGWVVGAGLLGLAAVILADGFRLPKSEARRAGPTTEVAALLMFLVGALLAVDQMVVAIALGGSVAVLLQGKERLHRFVRRAGESEVQAVFRLALIGLVVLPVLPNRTFGPYDVLNPFQIWLMVVLIGGISLAGYLAARLIGARAGSVLGGVLGGLISSTATTVSYARRSRAGANTAGLDAMVIVAASAVVFGRVAVEIGIVAPAVLLAVWPQLLTMAVLMAVLAAAAFLTAGDGTAQPPAEEHPDDLKAAMVFGLLYTLVLVAVAMAKRHFGDEGLYVVAAISGLTDLDAITLSTTKMIASDRIDVDVGWRMMLLGAMSNLVFKGGAVMALGSPALKRRIALFFGAALAGGAVLLVAWPAG